MKKVIYYVAASLDGFIAGLDDDISGFSNDESFVAHYQEQLQAFETVIMGRKTYEFGYKYGLKAGAKAYPHMNHYIFSQSLKLPEESEVKRVSKNFVNVIQQLKSESRTDIYLCGGSEFASFLASKGLIDSLWIKLNPFVMGEGKPLFAGKQSLKLQLNSQSSFQCGVQELRYSIVS